MTDGKGLGTGQKTRTLEPPQGCGTQFSDALNRQSI